MACLYLFCRKLFGWHSAYGGGCGSRHRDCHVDFIVVTRSLDPTVVIPAECPTCLTRWQDSEVIEGDRCPRCVEEEEE